MNQDEVFKLLCQARDGAREVADASDDWAIRDYFKRVAVQISSLLEGAAE